MPETPVKDMEKHREDEKRRANQDKDKRSKKDLIYEEDEVAVKSRNKAGRFIKPEKKAEEKEEEQIKVVTVPDSLTIKELADKMKIQPSVIIKKLFMQGQIVTLNSEVSYEDAENIAIEYDIICEKEVKVDVIEELLKEDEEDEEDGLDEIEDEEGLLDIEDEEVPLAEAVVSSGVHHYVQHVCELVASGLLPIFLAGSNRKKKKEVSGLKERLEGGTERKDN